MSLLEDLRVTVRVTTTKTDSEIQAWIDAALADMKRVGIRSELLAAEAPAPLVKAAIISYVKANYGYDNAEAPRFQAMYNATVASLLNSDANECSQIEPAEDVEDDT